MATITTDLICNLNQPVAATFLHGNLFSQDNAGNTINVHVMDNGEPATIGGTVSANVIRADGNTVAVSGTIEGNKASVVLPQACYAVPGRVEIIIKLTQSTTITTIAAIVANVYRSTTDTVVDPGTIIPSIQTLIAEIEEAVDSIPVDYSGLLATIAADYSPSKTYPVVGMYAWQGGVLKRNIVPITTAETYTAAHWTNAVLGDDLSALKSAFNKNSGGTFIELNPNHYITNNQNAGVTVDYSSPSSSSSGYGCAVVDCAEGDIFTFYGNGGNSARLWAFINSSDKMISKADSNATANGKAVVAPTNAAKCIINIIGTAFKGESVDNRIDEANAEVQNVIGAVARMTGNEDVLFTKNKYIPLGAAESTTTAVPKTDADTDCIMVSCTPGETFILTGDGWSSSAYRLYAFLSEPVGGTYTVVKAAGTSESERTARNLKIVAPSGAAYLAVNVKNGTSTKPMLIKGNPIVDVVDGVITDMADSVGYVKYKITSGKYIPLGSRGSTTSATKTSASDTGCFFVECDPGDVFDLTADAWSAAGYNLYAFLSELSNGVYTIIKTTGETSARNMRLVAPYGAKYLAVNVKTNTATVPVLTKNGSVNFRIESAIDDISENVGYTNDITYQTELIPSYGVRGADGELGSSTAYSHTDYIELDTEKYDRIRYSRITSTSVVGNGGMAFYDADKVYISGVNALLTTPVGFVDNTVIIPKNAKYARFTCRDESIDNFYIILVNSGEPQKEIDRGCPDVVSPMAFCPSGIFTNDDVQTGLFETANDVYSAYDTLFSGHSEISKNLIGYGSNENGEADNTLPIYEYVIPNPVTGNSVTHAVKVLLTSGMHGNEPLAVTGLYNFIRSLYDGENDFGSFIKNICGFVIVPVCNPGGFNDRTRQNRHGVDINRNFSFNWGVHQDRGASKYSEVETQALKAWIEANLDALFMIDFHNHNQLEQGSTEIMYYTASNVPMHKKAWSFAFRSLINYMKSKFDLDISTYNHVFEANNIPSFSAEAYEVYGIDASVFETPGGTSAEYARRTSVTSANFVLSLLRNYRV